ncbi:cupin domain-containing protein [Mycoplasmatota bacterium WC44]
MKVKNLSESFDKVEELCSPRIISSVGDCYVKIAKVQGVLPIHTHDNEDELFIVYKGNMILEVEGTQFNLNEGDVFLVEKGKMHRPIAKEVCEVLLVEKKTTLHTGSDDTNITRSIEDQLRPL